MRRTAQQSVGAAVGRRNNHNLLRTSEQLGNIVGADQRDVGGQDQKAGCPQLDRTMRACGDRSVQSQAGVTHKIAA